MPKKLDYKKELETAAKTMILIHRPETLIKMIARMIVRKVKVTHAGILLHDSKRDSYTFTVSRGITGLKIPAGYARIKADNQLIKVFSTKNIKKLISDGVLVYEDLKRILRKKKLPRVHKEFLTKLKNQMDTFEVALCIPSYMPAYSAIPQPKIVIKDIPLSALSESTHSNQNTLLGLLMLGKKVSKKRFSKEEVDFFTALSSDVAMAIRNAQLFAELQSELGKKYRLFIHTTIALAAAIDAKDHYTRGHTERVTSYSLAIAKKIISNAKKKSDFSPKFLENIHVAALLHDIGKIGISELILNKKSDLTPAEREKIQDHPLIGVAILQPIKELEEPIAGVKYHHERYDGKGYPEGLKGEKIPLIAAIIAVADVFDAMTTDRPYRAALSKEEAFIEIEKSSGTQFNPIVTEALSELHREGKI